MWREEEVTKMKKRREGRMDLVHKMLAEIRQPVEHNDSLSRKQANKKGHIHRTLMPIYKQTKLGF
jgi:hypothetical protein